MTKTAKILQVTIVILGMVIVGIGCHAYFESEFNEYNKDSDQHKRCVVDAVRIRKICPPFSYETYFITITIAALILSLLLLPANHFSSSVLLNRVNPPFHIIAGLLVIAGGIFFVISASQIYTFLKESNKHYTRNQLDYFDQKIIAGGLSILNGVLYLVSGVYAYTGPTT